MRLVTYLCLVLALLGSAAGAATLDCTIPAANVTRGTELCEELRLGLRIRASDWSNDVCASQFLRMGMIQGERESAERAARATVAGDVTAAVSAFLGTWARPTEVACGDGTLDTEFGEACDDGNTDNGDGCSNSCGIE